jgi:peptidylprolyl isomerase
VNAAQTMAAMMRRHSISMKLGLPLRANGDPLTHKFGKNVLMNDISRTKPEIEFPDGPAPVDLLIVDIVEGSGEVARESSTVDVHYLGVEYDSGEEFDSSWSRGESINFPLRQLIQGWQVGIPGMKVGGRRKLIVPAAQAYGTAGGHPLSGKTLIFVIDLLGVS